MLVVIRSPHGEAEVRVDRNGTDATIADLLSAVTGEVAPSTVFLDGRAVATTELIETSVPDGSILDADWPSPAAPADLELVVAAGPGSGISRRLSSGRYRIGPGSHTRGAELADGVGVDPRLELEVVTGGAARVQATGGWLAGSPVAGAVPWTAGTLRVADHAFVVRDASRREIRRRQSVHDGAVTFHRPPRTQPDGSRPSVAEIVSWACTTDPALWHRRPGHPDAFVLAVGVDTTGMPASVDIDDHHGVGIIAEVEAANAMARALVLGLAVLHGPADVELVVATSAARAPAWEWVKWLPHTRVGGQLAVLTDPAAAREWADASGTERSTGRSHRAIVVTDDPVLWTGRDAPLRNRLADDSPVRLIALAAHRDVLPAACTALLADAGDGTVSVDDLSRGTTVTGVLPILLDADVALEAARRLAPLEDPELPGDDPTALPTHVPICTALGVEEITGTAIRRRWELFEGRPVVTIGAAPSGMLDIDLAADGPHVLLAGSDAAAVGELLQTIALGLAANCSPDDLEILLVAPGGAGGLATCARLPHCVGLVAELDEHGAHRLLRCLRAELAHRERQLLAGGASSFDRRWSMRSELPPRLVVLVDGLDDVVAGAPGFLGGLVEIAQRGRTTGVHLVLCCARPAEVLDSKIRAQVHVRMALRLDSEPDSIDLVGTRQAARLPRATSGRAVVRVGAEAPMTVQTAHTTGHSGVERMGMIVTPFVIARTTSALEQRMLRAARLARPDPEQASDLEMLVGAIDDAARQSASRQPLALCPEPLPRTLTLDDMLARNPGDAVPYALADQPDEQRTAVRWWQPDRDGSLLAYGTPESGTTSLLMTLILGGAERHSADDLHLYVIAADHQPFLPLYGLPHLGAVVPIGDHDRVGRVLAHLLDELTRRASTKETGEPTIVLMVDDVGELGRIDPSADRRQWRDLERIVRDGPALGICAVCTARHPEDVPGAIVRHVDEQLLLQPDAATLLRFGFARAEGPPHVPGRALAVNDRSELQIARPPGAAAMTVEEIAAAGSPGSRPPRHIGTGSATIDIHPLLRRAHHAVGRLSAPVGVDARDLSPVALALDHGGVAFVAGPPHSGRSTVLTSVGLAAIEADDDLQLYVIEHHPGPTVALGGRASRAAPGEIGPLVERILADTRPRLVLVDDADLIDDPALAALADGQDDSLMLVVAGVADHLRARDHWTRPLRRARTGVLLQPGPSDGELVRVLLPPRPEPFPVGHGYVVNDADIVPVIAAALGGETP